MLFSLLYERKNVIKGIKGKYIKGKNRAQKPLGAGRENLLPNQAFSAKGVLLAALNKVRTAAPESVPKRA